MRIMIIISPSMLGVSRLLVMMLWRVDEQVAMSVYGVATGDIEVATAGTEVATVDGSHDNDASSL